MYQNGGLKAIWFGTETSDYFPLTLTTLWLEWRLFGMKPLGYHVVNVLLHALGAVLLWRVLLRLKIPGAFVAAAIFAVHPVCVGSVAWIAERKNTLSLVFFLLTLLLYLKADEQSETSDSPRAVAGTLHSKWYFFSLSAFLLALLSKTSVVMLPVILLGCAWWRRGKLQKSDFIGTVPFFVLSLVLGLITVNFQTHYTFTTKPDSLLVRILGGGWAIWFYLFKAILPVKLSMVYPRWEIQTSSPLAWLPWFLWFALLGIFWRFRRSWGKPLLFASSYFFITLLPVLGFFDMSFFAFSRVADHLVYLSIISIVAFGAAALTGGWRKQGVIPSQNRSRFSFLAAVVIGSFTMLSWSRAHVFTSSEKLWRETLKQNPKAWAAYNHLGEALVWKGEVEQSIELFRSAVRLNSDYAFAQHNLGNAYAALKRFDEAFPCFEKALQVWPDYAQAENSWGMALLGNNQPDEAIQRFRNALKHAPKYMDAHYNLAVTLSQKGQFAEAVEHHRATLHFKPDDVKARLNLATALSEMDKLEEAVAEYNEAIRLQPSLAEAHHGLGMVMVRKNRFEEAVRCFREALRLDPENVTIQRKLAEAQTGANGVRMQPTSFQSR